MTFNGVEILKLQFSRAIDQTFEQFLDAWSMPSSHDSSVHGFVDDGQFPAEIPVISAN